MDNNCELKTKPWTIKEYLKSWNFWKPFSAIVLGGIAGFLYYYFIDCASGSCAITGNSYMSII